MFENILYATDFSESPLMLPCIGIIGKTKKIHLLHVMDENTYIDPALVEPRMLEAKLFLEDELNKERKKGVEADVHLMAGVPGRKICEVAGNVGASLIVLNYHSPGGVAGSATLELVRNCDRSVLAMTKLSSDAVDRPGDAMDEYCTALFSRVLCPIVGDPALKLDALRSLRKEVSLSSVTFLCMPGSFKPIPLLDALRSMGIRGGVIEAENKPADEVVKAAEVTGASVIMFDARTEMGLALSVIGRSTIPMLVLK